MPSKKTVKAAEPTSIMVVKSDRRETRRAHVGERKTNGPKEK
jgi:hypothetical protein